MAKAWWRCPLRHGCRGPASESTAQAGSPRARRKRRRWPRWSATARSHLDGPAIRPDVLERAQPLVAGEVNRINPGAVSTTSDGWIGRNPGRSTPKPGDSVPDSRNWITAVGPSSRPGTPRAWVDPTRGTFSRSGRSGSRGRRSRRPTRRGSARAGAPRRLPRAHFGASRPAASVAGASRRRLSAPAGL